jgi:hypothetical protein
MFVMNITAFNEWLAVKINDNVGTMYMAYLFAVIGIMGIVGALTGNTGLVLIVGSISGYFLQLVLLPIIMVAGKLQSEHTIHHVKKHMDMHHAEHMAALKKVSK